jgi:Permuted papain-like amidase enzyme, YaeF/YiiX, C92 family
VFTLDTGGIGSRLITYLDQGTWSHVGSYVGEGRIIEAITSGVTERSIEAYHHPRYRLGIYRLPGSPEQFDKMIEWSRSQLGKQYAFKKVLRLGIRMILGIWPDPIEPRQVTPNRAIAFWPFRLVEVV